MTAIVEPSNRRALSLSPEAEKRVFTTGQISKICKVAPRTASKWFDTGRLKGYRIPGSEYRRVPARALFEFMVEHKMHELIPQELIAHTTAVLYAFLPAGYPAPSNCDNFTRADSEFNAAVWAVDGMNTDGRVFIGTELGYSTALKLARRVYERLPRASVWIVYTEHDLGDMPADFAVDPVRIMRADNMEEFATKAASVLAE